MRKALQPVTAYIWRAGSWDPDREIRIPKIDWWNGSLRIDGKKRFIIINPKWLFAPEPDAEQLACGHEQDVKRGYRGTARKHYNNRRVCRLCAIGAVEVVA